MARQFPTDGGQATLYLSLLDPDPNAIFHFRTIAEAPGARGASKYSGTFAHCRPQLERDNAQGRGVFVVVNAGGHCAKDITHVRALFADCDDASKPWKVCAVRGRDPHMVIETSPGKWHAYWLVSDFPLAEFKHAQSEIAAAFDTDASVTDLPRLMRLPGFTHNKGAGHDVRIAACSWRPRFSVGDFSAPWGVAVAPKIPEGMRNTELLKIAGKLRRQGQNYDQILAVLISTPVEGIMERAELERIAKSAMRWEPEGTPPAKPATLAVGGLGGPGGLQLVRGDEINPEPVSWLWRGWLAEGKFHLLAGAPGCGKTTTACALAATITRGGLWPDQSQAPVGDVLVWSGEDDIADTLVPRFLACGADMARVRFVGSVAVNGTQAAFDPGSHMPLLEAELSRHESIKLMIVDPIVSAIEGDSHKNAEVRRGLQPLVDLAAKHSIALIGISHFSKGTQGRNPTERVTGSIAFSALARVVMIAAVSDSPTGVNYVLARSKSNIGPSNGGFGYQLSFPEIPGFPGVIGSCVHWGDAIEGNARDILSASEEDGGDSSSRNEAKEWLSDKLRDGAVASSYLKNEGKAAGYSWRTLERAKKDLGAKAHKNADTGQWEWSARKLAEGLTPPPLPS